MSWSSNRQMLYGGSLLLFVLAILAYFLYPVFYHAPTCFDRKQNADEKGIDCGGNSCQNFCPFQVSEPSILWSRIFPVSGSNYNLVAYVENQNVNAGVSDVTYEFRVYDTNGKYIGRREGHTFIPPNQRFAIFESRFDTGTSTPKSTTFAFTNSMTWLKQSSITAKLPLRVDSINYATDSGSPRLQARITNESIYPAPAFDVITILYNEAKNAIAVSKTHLDGLASNKSAPLLFTWPSTFPETPVVKDILPQINPFLVTF